MEDIDPLPTELIRFSVSEREILLAACVLHLTVYVRTVDVEAMKEYAEALEESKRCMFNFYILSKRFCVVSGEFEIILPEVAEEDMADARKTVSSE